MHCSVWRFLFHFESGTGPKPLAFSDSRSNPQTAGGHSLRGATTKRGKERSGDVTATGYCLRSGNPLRSSTW